MSGALRDKRAKAQQVIFSRPASGLRIVASRYLANLVMLSLPVAVWAFRVQQPCYDRALALGVQGDMWAFVTVPGVWLLPEIMIVLALSFLITELTDTVLAVFVQVAWGIGSIFGADTLVGNFGLKLVARWNTMGENGEENCCGEIRKADGKLCKKTILSSSFADPFACGSFRRVCEL